MSGRDQITLEVIKNRLDSVADQIALVLMRSAYSPIVRDSLDYSTAVCDRDGRFIAQGLMTALHLGSFPYAMRNLIGQARSGMRSGDIFIFAHGKEKKLLAKVESDEPVHPGLIFANGTLYVTGESRLFAIRSPK